MILRELAYLQEAKLNGVNGFIAPLYSLTLMRGLAAGTMVFLLSARTLQYIPRNSE